MPDQLSAGNTRVKKFASPVAVTPYEVISELISSMLLRFNVHPERLFSYGKLKGT